MNTKPTAESTPAPKTKKPVNPMSLGTRRLIAVVASVAWGFLTTMLVCDWLYGLYTPDNMATLMPSLVIILASVPLAIATITTKHIAWLAHIYQPLALAVLLMMVYPFYVPVVILCGTVWIALTWVRRTPKFWSDRGQSTEK